MQASQASKRPAGRWPGSVWSIYNILDAKHIVHKPDFICRPCAKASTDRSQTTAWHLTFTRVFESEPRPRQPAQHTKPCCGRGARLGIPCERSCPLSWGGQWQRPGRQRSRQSWPAQPRPVTCVGASFGSGRASFAPAPQAVCKAERPGRWRWLALCRHGPPLSPPSARSVWRALHA